MIREGAHVAYTGPERGGLTVGDRGRVISADGDVCHVLWSDGGLVHQATALYESSLVVMSGAASSDLDDSLEVGGLVTFSARASFDTGGAEAVVSEMAEMGHLATFGEIAEEALTLVTARIRQDPSFRAVTAHLEEDEAERVYLVASACLIRDAFGGGDE